MDSYYSIEISATTVAWYGAIVATFGLLLSLYNVLRDRARIKIKYQRDMTITGNQSIYPADKTYFVVTVINKGRRPINISSAGLRTLGRRTKYSLLSDSFSPHRNRVLTEEKPSTQFIVEQYDEVLKGTLYICVYDETGREYRKYLHILPTFWALWYLLKLRLKRKRSQKPSSARSAPA